MSLVTSALIDYWHCLPARSPAVRRQHLALACEDVRSGRLAPEALLPFALGDVDDEIVRRATHAYLETAGGPVAGGCPPSAIDACEWVRRDLALNRGAVFAALLESADDAVLARLAALRLALAPQAVDTICRMVADRPSRVVGRFLHEWHELLEGSDDPVLRRVRELIAASLGTQAASVLVEHTETGPSLLLEPVAA
jgi:hypothetical protein